MKLQLVTIGKPKLAYAQAGLTEYVSRLQRFATMRLTQLPDKYAHDAGKITETTRGTFTIALEITGQQPTSEELSLLLTSWELHGKEISFVIGGPDGLPQSVRDTADYRWSLGHGTLPHDLAMVVAAEQLYRALTIKAGLPYHR